VGCLGCPQQYFSIRYYAQPDYYQFVQPLVGTGFRLAQRLGLATPTLYQNWLTVEDLTDLLNLADCKVIKRTQEILLPLPIWLLADFCNRFLVKLWPLKHLA
jgi:hypothetical protein